MPHGLLSDIAKNTNGAGKNVETFLAIAFGKMLGPSQRDAILAAAAMSRQDDQASANIRLATSRLVRIPHPDGLPERLALAESLIGKGASPAAVLKNLDFDSRLKALEKYDPDQPRVPAGNGRESGQWTNGDPSAVSGRPKSSLFDKRFQKP